MVCNFKRYAALGVALLTLCGLVASPSSAHTPALFTSEGEVTTITGTDHGPYKVTATEVAMKCEIVEFHGTLEGTSNEQIALVPTITECTAFGLPGRLTGFGHYGEEDPCHLVLHAEGTGDLVCPPGGEVTMEAATCKVHMPPQTGVKSISFTKSKHQGKDALTVELNFDNLHGVHTDSIGCPFNGGGTFTNTKAQGVGIMWAEDLAGNPVDLTRDATIP